MTVPANGIERLIHFVDARIAQLNLSKEEVARRGGPNPDTLAKIRARTTSRTPNVETLLAVEIVAWKRDWSSEFAHAVLRVAQGDSGSLDWEDAMRIARREAATS